jgi:CheY-like chemotaxis protein
MLDAVQPSCRVLFIDDDPVARMSVELLLSDAGMDVFAIGSPIGATRLIREHAIDVVVCDLNMPCMRGDSFARLFRSNRHYRRLPLVLLSGASEDQLDDVRGDPNLSAVVQKDELETALVPIIRRLTRRF